MKKRERKGRGKRREVAKIRTDGLQWPEVFRPAKKSQEMGQSLEEQLFAVRSLYSKHTFHKRLEKWFQKSLGYKKLLSVDCYCIMKNQKQLIKKKKKL